MLTRLYFSLTVPLMQCYSIVSARLSVVCNICIVVKRYVQEKKLLQLRPIGSRLWGIDWEQNEWSWPSFRSRL